MAVTKFPSTEILHPLYNPIQVNWDFSLSYQTGIPNEILENVRIEVDFLWGGTSYTQSFYAYAVRNELVTGARNSYFEIDLSGIIKPFSRPNANFCSVPFPSINDAELMPHGQVITVRIYTNIRLTDNTLEETLAEEILDSFFIISGGINRWTSVKSLIPFYDSTNTQTPSHARRFLTNMQDVKMSRNKKAWISLFQDAGDYFRQTIEYIPNNSSTPVTIDLDSQLGDYGVANIRIDPSTLPTYLKRFTVRCFDTDLNRQISETIPIYLCDCDMSTPMQWINEFGGLDYYEFLGEQVGAFTSDSSYAARQPINLSAESRGIFKVQANGKESFVIRDTVTYDRIASLKYLQLTPEAYIFIDGQWCNCVVLDAKFPTSDNTSPFYEIEITLQLNNPISQSN